LIGIKKYILSDSPKQIKNVGAVIFFSRHFARVVWHIFVHYQIKKI